MTSRNVRRLDLTLLEGREVPALIGSLDLSFANAGKANFTVAAGTNQANAVTVDNLGRIILAGTTDATNPSNSDFFVTRHNADGSFDTSFGTGGKVVFGVANKDDVVTDVMALPNGSIIGVGYTNRSGNYDMAVFKLNPNGGLDTSFAGGTGLKLISNGPLHDKAYTVALTSSRIVVGGASDVDGLGLVNKDDLFVAVLDYEGNFDPTFNAGAAKVFDLLQQEQIRSLGIDQDNSIIAVGYRQNPTVATSSDMFIMRILADGSATSPNFGATTISGHKVTLIDFASNNDKAYSVTMDSNNNLLVAGSAFITPDTDFAVARVKSVDGLLDTTFGIDGKATFDLGGNDLAYDVSTDIRGRIILSGSAFKGDSFDFTVAAVEANGSALSPGFGTNGVVYTNILSEDKAFAAEIDNAGRIVVAGRALGNVAVMRLNGRIGESFALGVSGSPDGRALEYFPSTPTQYGTPGTSVQLLNSFNNLIRVAIADVNGDGTLDRVAAAGPGGLPLLAVQNGATGATITNQFNVFESTFTGGMYVVAGDLNNDGFADLVVTADQSGGPVVVIYDGAKLAAGKFGDEAQIIRFFGIDDPNFRGGARPALGDVNGDGFLDVLIAAGIGGGPRVALFNGKALLNGVATINAANGKPDGSFRLRPDFFVFEDTLRNGAFATMGDLNGDGFADLAFGGGPGGGPRVRIVSGASLLALGTLEALDKVPQAGLQLNNFMAGDPNSRGGVRLAMRDLDGDNFADLITASGDNLPSKVQVFRGLSLLGKDNPVADQTIDPYASAVLPNGVFVG